MKKTAYLILAHNDPTHLAKLTKTLGKENDIYVHLDAKTDPKEYIEKCPPSTNFIKDRVNVAWAGISMVDALLNLIKAALELSEHYTHLIFISGSDYPIKSIEEINNTFTSNPQREFIKFIDMRDSPEHYLKQVTRKQYLEPLLRTQNKLLKLLDKSTRKVLRGLKIRNKWQANITPYYGHTWCALTPKCCEYILNFHNTNNWFYEMNKNTFAADEHYFHTIIGNSPFASRADGLQTHEGSGLWRLTNFHLICPSLTKWFTLNDWEQIEKSEKLFVRKVSTSKSSSLLDKIDHHLYKQT